jgi:hypothetical protein
LTFLGMCAIMDPPRDDAEVAIRDCKVTPKASNQVYESVFVESGYQCIHGDR